MTDDPDPRWSKLHDQDWICPCCGQKHAGLFDLACNHPDFWEGDPEKKPNSELLAADHILTEDFCILDGEHFYVRSVLNVPILGRPGDEFGFGVWVSLSKTNFEPYRDTFDSGEQGHLGSWFGWFSNRLLGYPDTLNLKCQVYPQDGRERPQIELEPTEHPLAVEQRDGISLNRILEIYALYGHDMRDALAQP